MWAWASDNRPCGRKRNSSSRHVHTRICRKAALWTAEIPGTRGVMKWVPSRNMTTRMAPGDGAFVTADAAGEQG